MLRTIALVLALSAPPLAANAQEVKLNVIQETLELKKSDIVSAEAVMQDGRWVVQIKFSPDAGKQLADLTTRNLKKPMQLVIGDRVVSTPIVQTPITGGGMVITGNFTEARAKEMAAQLKQ